MDTSPEARRRRAERRRQEMILGDVPLPETGLGRMELAFRLTRAAWAMSGASWPNYTRAEMPIRKIWGHDDGG
jgi:hypothetical protein